MLHKSKQKLNRREIPKGKKENEQGRGNSVPLIPNVRNQQQTCDVSGT